MDSSKGFALTADVTDAPAVKVPPHYSGVSIIVSGDLGGGVLTISVSSEKPDAPVAEFVFETGDSDFLLTGEYAVVTYTLSGSTAPDATLGMFMVP